MSLRSLKHELAVLGHVDLANAVEVISKTNKKIDIFVDGKYACSTMQAKNLKEAKEKFLKDPSWQGLTGPNKLGKNTLEDIKNRKVTVSYASVKAQAVANKYNAKQLLTGMRNDTTYVTTRGTYGDGDGTVTVDEDLIESFEYADVFKLKDLIDIRKDAYDDIIDYVSRVDKNFEINDYYVLIEDNQYLLAW